MKFYIALASALAARNACVPIHSQSIALWSEYIDQLVRDHAPSGEGFTNGTTLNSLQSAIGGTKPQRLVFDTEFHHMPHQVWVYPWFDGLDIRVTGRDAAGSKARIADVFHSMAAHDAMSFADYRNMVTSRARGEV